MLDIKIDPNQPGQQQFLEDLEPGWTAYIGGYGSGKSWAASRKFALIHLMNQDLGFIVTSTWDDIARIIIPQFEEIGEEWGLKIKNDLGSQTRPKAIYIEGSKYPILLLSGDKPERIAGFNASHVYIDEGARMPMHPVPKRCMITQARGRLRNAQGKVGLFGIVATTPEGINKKCWVYNDFYKDPKPNHRAYFGKTALNKYNHADYAKNLLSQFSKEAARQYLDGAFVNLGTVKAHPEFDKAVHVKPGFYPKSDSKILIGCDFNVDNCSWVLGFEHGDGKIHILDELIMEKDARVDMMVVAASERGWGSYGPVHVYVDKSSKARSVVGDTPSQVMRKEAKRLNWTIAHFDDTGSNPAVFDRIMRVNRFLKDARGEVSLTVDPHCETLINHLSDAPLVNGGYDKKNDDPHELDGLGYMVYFHSSGQTVSQANF